MVLLCRWSGRDTDGSRFFLAQTILLELTHKGGLVNGGLEATVSEFGAGVDEFKIDLLQRRSLGVHQQGLRKVKTFSRYVTSLVTYHDINISNI